MGKGYFVTLIAFVKLLYIPETLDPRLYHHSFHYCGYVSLALLNNEKCLHILFLSLMYWIGVSINKTEIPALFILFNSIKLLKSGHFNSEKG